MPRIGAEPERRRALIHAAIEMIGEQGSLDVSVKEIAQQAGMSPALAFHYFGGKDEIILQTMRYLLREFSTSVVRELMKSNSPIERVEALIAASFSSEQFERKTIAAWLVFYLHAYSSIEAARLLRIYTQRLHSNLVAALKYLTDHDNAYQIADGLGALIDGLYIRQALVHEVADGAQATAICRTYLNNSLKAVNPSKGIH